jgi:carbonic anhydrase
MLRGNRRAKDAACGDLCPMLPLNRFHRQENDMSDTGNAPATPPLDRLIAGYRRFRETGWTRTATVGAIGRRPAAAGHGDRLFRQPRRPFADFRRRSGRNLCGAQCRRLVPPFETTPGHHGVSAALEFAVQVLKVREIIVMGHGLCGGCKAALTQELQGTEPGQGGFVADWIALLDEARDSVAHVHGTTGRPAERAMEQAGVKVSLENLRTSLRSAKGGQGTLTLRGAFFAISDGVLHLLDESTGEFAPVE